MSPQKKPNQPCAVIITAIPLEYQAVRRHLTEQNELTHKGIIFCEGRFQGKENLWRVGLGMSGMGNITSGLITDRAIDCFNPDVMIFVGIAGGIKDVKAGDVVVADKVYNYESGKVGSETVQYRPHIGLADSSFFSRAFNETINEDWKERIFVPDENLIPKVFLKPIATGEKVITSTDSQLYKDIRAHFNDAIAVDMESGGFLTAVHFNEGVKALVIRGISDLIDNKAELDSQGFQEIAADNASAFAFEVLSKYRF